MTEFFFQKIDLLINLRNPPTHPPGLIDRYAVVFVFVVVVVAAVVVVVVVVVVGPSL